MSTKRIRHVRALALTAAATVAGLTLGTQTATAAPAAAAGKTITYQGNTFTVPASWPVIDLAAHPTACVRVDRHAVYLGAPGLDQDCPAGLVGRTGALIVSPAGPVTASALTDRPAAHEFDGVAGGVRITVSYGSDRATAASIVSGARFAATPAHAATAAGTAATAGTATAGTIAAVVPMAVSLGATNYTGKGFDPCAAPSSTVMSSWKTSSPYAAIGVYIGGENRSCSQPNLTASYVSSLTSAGWHFMPLYVGKQAPTTSCGCSVITAPTSQGTAAADDAVNKAAALGFGAGTPIYYDMESYSSSSTTTVLTFLSAWTSELHDRGYNSAVYSSSSSGINDLADHYNDYAMPDVISIARWNGVADTSDPNVPASLWANHQRNHQYSGGHNETWGGHTINIDNDYMDVQIGGASGGRSGPLLPYDNGDGTMGLYRWSSSGSSFGNLNKYESGAYRYSNVGRRTATGDVNGDGKADVVQAYQTDDGTFDFHVFLDGSASAGIWYSSGPFHLSQVDGRLVVADFNGDGRAEPALIYDNGDGTQKFYRWLSTGTSFTRTTDYAGTGSFNLSNVDDRVAAADVTGDGKADIVETYQVADGTFNFYVFSGGLTSLGVWYSSGPFGLGPVDNRMVLGDFNGDGRAEPALIYDNGDGTQKFYRWLSTGTSFSRTTDYAGTGSFHLSNVGNRVAAADVTGDGHADIVEAYQLSDGTFSFYVFSSGLTSIGVWYTSGPFTLARTQDRLVLGAW